MAVAPVPTLLHLFHFVGVDWPSPANTGPPVRLSPITIATIIHGTCMVAIQPPFLAYLFSPTM
jgi:hypothetical protein